MKLALTILGVLMFAGAAIAEELPTTAPAADVATTDTATATADPSAAPVTAPAVKFPQAPQPWGAVLASVGDQSVRVSTIETNPEMVSLREQLMNQELFSALLRCYISKQNVKVTQDDIDKMLDQLRPMAAMQQRTVEQALADQKVTREQFIEQIALQKLIEERTGQAKIDQLIKDHPNYFDGRKVTASHILLAAAPIAPTAEQKEALEKLTAIRNDIVEGKITFEAAAAQHSACPSSKETPAGTLGEFAFSGQMTPAFAMAAFDLKEGEVSQIVRTEFGFHLIKVTKIVAGQEQVSATQPAARQAAQQALMARFQTDVFKSVLTDCPIEINKQAVEAMTQPAK